jgi:putative sterol carrier protein
VSTQERADKLIKTLTERVAAKPDGAKNWGGAILINFTNAEEVYYLKFGMDGKVEKVEKGYLKVLQKKGPQATINTTTDTVEAIYEGIIDGMGAMYSGAIKVDGPLDVVMKLAPAFM